MSESSPVARAFRFDGLTVRAICGAEADLTWIKEFLTPWLEPVSLDTTDCRVTLRIDDDAYARRVAAGPGADGATVHCFWQDRGAVRLPVWRAGPGDRCVFDHDHLKVFYTVGPDPTAIEILAQVGNAHGRFAFMRVIRELALVHTRAKGRILIHGAALTAGGRAFLISGPKGAGKTSLLVAHLLAGGAEMVSNDRVVVRLEAGEVIVRGMPTVVSIRRPTLDAHAALHERLERSGYHHRLTLAEAVRGERSSYRSRDGSIDLSPAQLCELVGARPCAEARLHGILFPAAGAVDGGAELAALSATAAVVRLADAFLDGDVNEALAERFFGSVIPGAAAPMSNDEETLHRMAAVPSFELRVAPNGTPGRSMMTEVVRRLDA